MHWLQPIMKKSTLRKSSYAPEHVALKKYLISVRKERNYSQRTLAKILSVHPSFVAKLEVGDRRLDLIEFVDYMSALKLCPIEQFRKLHAIISDQVHNEK